MNSLTFVARRDRIALRASRAAVAAIARGNAVDAALAAIASCAGPAAAVNAVKLGAERSLRLGPDHPECQERYHRYAELQLLPLDRAVRAVQVAVLMEKTLEHLQDRQRPHILIVRELALMLRWVRRFAPARWDTLRDAAMEGAQ